MADRPAKRWRRRLRRAAAAGVVLALALVLTWVLAGPRMVEAVLRDALRDQGFAGADVTVEGVSWSHVELGNLRLDEAGRFVAEDGRATYAPGGLWDGRLQTLVVTGAVWHVHVGEDGLDLRPFAELPGEGGDAGTGGLPVDRVVLQASTLVVHRGGKRWRMPVAARLEQDGGQISVAGEVRTPWQPIRLDGQFEPATGRAELTAIASDAPHDEAGDPLGLTLAWDPGGTLDVSMFGRHAGIDHVVAGRRLTIAGLSVDGSATLRIGDTVTVEQADVTLRAETVGSAGQTIEAAAIHLRRAEQDPPLRVSAWARGGGWAVTAFTASLPADVAAWSQPQTVPMTWAVTADLADDALAVEGASSFTWRGASAGPGVPAWRLSLDQFQVPDAREVLGVTLDGVRGAIASNGEANLHLASIDVPDIALQLRDLALDATLPLAGRADPARATLTTGPVRVADVGMPGLEATVTRADSGNAELQARWPLGSDDARLTAAGQVTLADAQPAVRLDLRAPAFTIAAGDPLHRLVRHFASDVRFAGRVGVDGTLAITPAEFTPRLTVSVTDATVSLPTDADDDPADQLTGIRGELTLTRFAPPVTPAGQRLEWEGGRLGDLKFGPGNARFALEAGAATPVFLERARFSLNEMGRYFVFGVRTDDEQGPGDTVYALDVFAKDVRLEPWLDLVAEDYLTGRGVLHGHVPVYLRVAPAWQLDFGEGFLLAESGGTLRVKDSPEAEQLLARHLPRLDLQNPGLSAEQARQQILDALKNFTYDRLRLDFLPRTRELDLQIHASGTGRGDIDVPVGGLTVNVRNFGAGLNEALRFHAGFGRQLDRVKNRITPSGRANPDAPADEPTEAEDDPIMDLFR